MFAMRSLMSAMVGSMEAAVVKRVHMAFCSAVSLDIIPAWCVFCFRYCHVTLAVMSFSSSWRSVSSTIPQRAPTMRSLAMLHSLQPFALCKVHVVLSLKSLQTHEHDIYLHSTQNCLIFQDTTPTHTS